MRYSDSGSINIVSNALKAEIVYAEKVLAPSSCWNQFQKFLKVLGVLIKGGGG